MPNIEIQGFSVNQSDDLIEKICVALKEIGLLKEAVITDIQSRVICCDDHNKMAPFIRICDTDAKRAGMILAAFRKHRLGVDTEVLHLQSFSEGKDMK